MASICHLDASIVTNNNYHYICLWVYLPNCEVILGKCSWVQKEKKGEEKIMEMGGDLMCIEPSMIEENARKPLVWYMQKEGKFFPFMEALNGHDENCSMQFADSWENYIVTINVISFHISKEVISLAIGLALKGRKWQKGTRVADEVSLQCFFFDGVEPIQHRGGFMWEKLLELWNEVCLILMKYLTLEGRYGVYYYYHFPLLNQFFHHDLIRIPFFLLHELEDIVIDIKEKMGKRVNFTILHQEILFKLYQFHIHLVPPKIVEIDIPTHPNPQPQFIPLRTMSPKDPTPQPLPSRSLVELKPTCLGKRRRSDKGKEKNMEESKEEGRGGSRRLGSLAKSNAKRKLKEGASQEEEMDLEDTGYRKQRMK